MYLRTRRYEFPGAEAVTIDRTPGYGIHILSGLEYDVDPRFSLRTEVKFRNVQFDAVNQFRQPSITYNNTVIPLDSQPFASRIAIDGMAPRLAFLNRGQGWVARKLREALPRIAEDSVHAALKEMLETHDANIARCAPFAAAG